jgi:hypothetical protein
MGAARRQRLNGFNSFGIKQQLAVSSSIGALNAAQNCGEENVKRKMENGKCERKLSGLVLPSRSCFSLHSPFSIVHSPLTLEIKSRW